MAKPRKATSDTFYDIFGAWPAADRAIALKVLEQTHRQILKIESRAVAGKTETEAGAAPVQAKLTEVIPGNSEHPAVFKTESGKLVAGGKREPDGGRPL